MRRGASAAQGSRQSAALRQALRAEAQRIEATEKDRFDTERTAMRSAELRQRFPRSLSGGTFFTPHLPRRAAPARDGSPLVHEYAAILKVNDAWIVTAPTFNPVSARSGWDRRPLHTPSLPGAVREKVHALEKLNFRFAGRTKHDMLVFKRLLNGRQRDRAWAARAALALGLSVALLTGSLFVVEYAF